MRNHSSISSLLKSIKDSKPEIPTVLGDFNKSEKMQIILFVIGRENKKTERKS